MAHPRAGESWPDGAAEAVLAAHADGANADSIAETFALSPDEVRAFLAERH